MGARGSTGITIALLASAALAGCAWAPGGSTRVPHSVYQSERFQSDETFSRLDALALVPGLRCGASVGVAISAVDDTSATLLRRADAALYRAKSLHRSAIELAAESFY